MSHNGVNKLLARIPITIYERSVHEQWDEGDWARWLNSQRGRAVPHLAGARLMSRPGPIPVLARVNEARWGRVR